MDDLLTMFASNESPAEISDSIKKILFAKSSEKIDQLKPMVASSMFNFEVPQDEE